MILSMPAQAWLFLSTVLVGVAIGLFYDVFRIFRKIIPHSTIVVQLEDLFFWLIVTIAVFYFMLHRNFGEIRPFTILGVIVGAALYFATISQWIVKVVVAVIKYVIKVFISVVRIIFTPLRLFFTWISPPFVSFFRKRRANVQNISRNGKMRMKKSARNWSIMRRKI